MNSNQVKAPVNPVLPPGYVPVHWPDKIQAGDIWWNQENQCWEKSLTPGIRATEGFYFRKEAA